MEPDDAVERAMYEAAGRALITDPRWPSMSAWEIARVAIDTANAFLEQSAYKVIDVPWDELG